MAIDEKKQEKRKRIVIETALMYWVVNAWDEKDIKSMELMDEFAYESNFRELFRLTSDRLRQKEDK